MEKESGSVYILNLKVLNWTIALIRTHAAIYIYIYIYICGCVCVHVGESLLPPVMMSIHDRYQWKFCLTGNPYCNNISARIKRVISTNGTQFNHKPTKILLNGYQIACQVNNSYSDVSITPLYASNNFTVHGQVLLNIWFIKYSSH